MRAGLRGAQGAGGGIGPGVAAPPQVVENTIYRWESKVGGMNVLETEWPREHVGAENAKLKSPRTEAMLDSAGL